MPTDKNKKEVKVRDLKPSKDAKGGAARNLNQQQHGSANRGTGHDQNSSRNLNQTRNLL